jgi:hypothetical protein
MKAGKFENLLIKNSFKIAIAIKDDNGIATIIRLLQPLMSLVNPTKPSSTIKRTGIKQNH